MSEKSWTNQKILHQLLSVVVRNIYKNTSEAINRFREDAADENPMHLKSRPIEIQMGGVLDIFDLIDGRRGPTDWPGIKLVNAETGEARYH
jgi:hypothetical protein